MRFSLFLIILSCIFVDNLSKYANEIGCRTATSSYHVHQVLLYHASDRHRHLLRRQVVLAQGIGQPCVRMACDQAAACHRSVHLPQPWEHRLRPESAVQPDSERVGMDNGFHKGFDGLAGEHSSALIYHGHGDDDGACSAGLFGHLLFGPQCGFHVEGVSSRFNQERIHSSLYERLDLYAVRLSERIERACSIFRPVQVGRHGQHVVRRADISEHEALLPRGGGVLVSDFSGQSCRLEIGLRVAMAAEGAGSDAVSPSREIGAVDLRNLFGAVDDERIGEPSVMG